MAATWYINGDSVERFGFRPAPPPAGRRSALALERPGITLPGVLGTLDAGSPSAGKPRVISIPGSIRGTSLSDALEKVRVLVALARRGTVELRCVDAPNIVIHGVLDGDQVAEAAFPQLKPSQLWATVTLRFLCHDPCWRDRDPLDIALGQVAVALPLGYSVSSPWTMEIFGSVDGAVTDPQVLYADAEGTTVQSFTLTGTLSSWATDATAMWRISTEGLVPRIRKRLLGVWANDDAALTAGAVFALDPRDGWPPDAIYPSVRLFDAAGRATGRLTYRRRHEL